MALLVASVGCTRRHDVVLISVDALRADHLGVVAQGGSSLTPNIDALAADSVRFEQAYAPISVTGPSLATVMTGLEPGEHGVVVNLPWRGNVLAAERETLAERLQRRGYRTAAFVSSVVLRPELGLNQGFGIYDGPPQAFRRTEETVDRAATWLRATEGPVFLWLHSFEPHGPWGTYAPLPGAAPWATGGGELARIAAYQHVDGISDPAFYRQSYARAVQYADAQVGRLIDVLKAQDRYDDALVILLADHGESFDERELWFEHSSEASEEQLHVPLLVKLPRAERAGEVRPGLVGLRDVLPLVMVRVGEGGPSILDTDFEGHPWLLGESSHCQGLVVQRCAPYGIEGKVFAYRSAKETFFRRATAQGVVWERYDRRADPGERSPSLVVPPAAVHTPLDSAARARVAMAASRPRLELAEEAAFDDVREALESLGYEVER
jgi:arylsulfatase A-like enzyme